ncbi:MAG TPA: ABC transporter substrate-binding protein [Candidatus Binatia bacterium]
MTLVHYLLLALILFPDYVYSEQQTLAFSSVDSPNANWYIAKEKQLYKKYGVDAELIYIPSSTTTISAVVAGSVAVGNISGGATANAAVGGANVVAIGCFINTLPYELIVQEAIRSAQQLKGKSVGISRVGSSSDVAARVLLKELKLEPDKTSRSCKWAVRLKEPQRSVRDGSRHFHRLPERFISPKECRTGFW